MIGLLYVAILAVAVILPDGIPCAPRSGGRLGEWLTIGALAGAAWVYAEGLKRLRARVRPENRPAEAPAAAATSSCGRPGTSCCARSAGRGRSGSGRRRCWWWGRGDSARPRSSISRRRGWGRSGVIDDDVVEVTNLQRQVIHTDDRTGMPKVFSAEMAMRAQNPAVEVRPYNRRLDAGIAEALFRRLRPDPRRDGQFRDALSGEPGGRRHGQAADRRGAVAVGGADQRLRAPATGTPCYACVFPEAPAPGLAPSCAEAGVLGPLPGVVGAMMAVEAVKEITGAGESLRGRMLIYDALHADVRVIGLKKRAGCAVCGG
jgi:hypothetical protein